MSNLRLLAGPSLGSGPEWLASHTLRLGPLPRHDDLIEMLDRSGLTGRGGASFPVGAKWRAVASSPGGPPVVVVNGAEGEPQSKKDRLLMTSRPHLILDGAFLAARALRATQVVIYIGEAHAAAGDAMGRALSERPEQERNITRITSAPARYVAGESSAAVHHIARGVATPTTTPPHPRDRGVGGSPTLIQNVETLGHVALVARHGDGWYRSAGRRGAAGTLLITIGGAVASPGVLEVEAGTTIGEAGAIAGGITEPAAAVLIGGYFGSWVEAPRAWNLPLDEPTLRANGISLGCGVVGVLPASRCGVCETARVMRFLAGESSAQCGPCFFGLRGLADASGRIAEHGANQDDLQRLRRWAVEVRGRGACRHPDGAVMFLQSALETFGVDFQRHQPHAATGRAA
jgi:NADH:ubiquinone oxidoreductase subunit F (NADH-binding)